MLIKKTFFIILLLLVSIVFLPFRVKAVTYEYDDLNRLVRAVYSENKYIQYSYDNAGNRLSMIVETTAEPDISISPATYEFGNIKIGENSLTQTFTIFNQGDGILTIDTIEITGPDASEFSIQNDVCSGQTLYPSATCIMGVIFSPISVGTKSASLSISSNDPDTPNMDISLTGTGITPEIEIIPSSKSFGNIEIGETVTQGFTVSNTGTADLVISSITINNENVTGQFTEDGEPQTIMTGESCTITVFYSPDSLGIHTADLVILSNDLDEDTTTIHLSGTGVAPEIDVSPTNKDFGNIALGTTITQGFTISNTGTADLTISSIAIANENVAGQFTENGASQTILPGGFYIVTVSYSPNGLSIHTADLVILSNDSDENTITISLNGTGVSPEIDISPANKDFGSIAIGTSITQGFVISNTGTADLTISSITIANENVAGQFTEDGEAQTIFPGGSVTVTVAYTPIAVGIHTADLVVLSNDLDEGTIAIVLNGTGIALLTGINLSPVNPMIILGSTQQFTATGTYQDGSTSDITNTATWLSSNNSIATIDENGLAAGVGAGSTYITVSLDGVTSPINTLTVTNDIVSIVLSPIVPKIKLDNTQQFKAIGTYQDGSANDITTSVTWSSSNTDVAIIDDGLVTPVGIGRTFITATFDSITSRINILNIYPGWYDDAGNPENEPHLILGNDSAVFGSLPEETIAYGPEVIFQYNGFDFSKPYTVTLTYYNPTAEEFDYTTYLETENCTLIHGDITPDHGINRYTFDLPQADYADGTIELHFKPNNDNSQAIVSEILIEEGDISPSYQIPAQTIDGGSSDSFSINFQQTGITGQSTSIGSSESDNFNNQAGFIHY